MKKILSVIVLLLALLGILLAPGKFLTARNLMAVVQAVCQAHGGSFAVRSRQGFGTCVCITLPWLADPAPEEC